MKVGVMAFSDRGFATAERICAFFDAKADDVRIQRCPDGGLALWTKQHFSSDDALIFIGSCGIAVRAVAPFVESKTRDPAVLVIDDCAAFVVSLLSGHLGGANRLAARLGEYLNALPVITTATDRNGFHAIDTWADEHGLAIINPARIKRVSARMLAGETVKIKSVFPVAGTPPEGLMLSDSGYDVLISHRMHEKNDALHLVPAVLTLGIGCKKEVGADVIEQVFQSVMEEAGCEPTAVRQVCSINLKAGEPGILEFCQRHGLSYRTFTPQELLEVAGTFSKSDFVRSVTGTDNVCERSAVLGSGRDGQLLTGKVARAGVTMALAIAPYTVCFDEEKIRE